MGDNILYMCENKDRVGFKTWCIICGVGQIYGNDICRYLIKRCCIAIRLSFFLSVEGRKSGNIVRSTLALRTLYIKWHESRRKELMFK
jgi:hypothetical protein